MNHIEFIKKQAKNFLKDWQTQTKTVEDDGFISYHYDWKFYDVGDLFFYYELDDKDEQNSSLGHAQHYIAKMVGFEKWDDLVNASEPELELAELLLRRFKSSEDVQYWEELMHFQGMPDLDPKQLLDYAKWHYQLKDSMEIASYPLDKLTVLSGKLKSNEINNFDDEHNPDGILRKNSTVLCPGCNKTFSFKQSKVIKANDKNLTMVVCKNFPECRATYLDFQVLTPTVLLGTSRQEGLKKGLEVFGGFKMNTKIHCIHCDQEYLYNEASVVQFPNDDEPSVMCKHYPNCNGSLIDMMPVQ